MKHVASFFIHEGLYIKTDFYDLGDPTVCTVVALDEEVLSSIMDRTNLRNGLLLIGSRVGVLGNAVA